MIYQVVANQAYLLQQVRNVFYYDTGVIVPTDADLQALADEVRTSWVGSLAGALSTAYALNSVNLRRVDAPGFPGFDRAFTSGPLTGTNGNPPLATQLGLLVHGRSSTLRPNRVTSFMTGLCEDNFGTAGTYSTAILASMLTWALNMDSQATPSGTFFRVAVQWDLARTFVVAFNRPTSYSAVAVPGALGSRRIGSGQ